MKDSIVDFSQEFPIKISGFFSYINTNLKTGLNVFIELVLMGSVIAVHENISRQVILEMAQRQGNR